MKDLSAREKAMRKAIWDRLDPQSMKIARSFKNDLATPCPYPSKFEKSQMKSQKCITAIQYENNAENYQNSVKFRKIVINNGRKIMNLTEN